MYVAGLRARRPPDRRLVDGDHLVEMFQAVDPPMGAGIAEAGVQIAPQGLDQDVAHQRALARAGNAGDAHEHAQRNLDVDALEVVVRGAADDELGLARWAGDAAGISIRRRPERYCPVTLFGCGDDSARAARRPRRARRGRPARGRNRRCGRPPASCPRRARRRSRCCPGRGAGLAFPAGGRCRGGAARSKARRGCRARPPVRSRLARPAGSAAFRRRKASARCVPR